MRKITNDNRGITIIHALVCIIIFAIFSSIILAATSANLKSAKAQKNYQQAYISVSDAADLFMKGLEGDCFVYEKTETVALDNDGTELEDTTAAVGKWSYLESENSGIKNIFVKDEMESSNFLATFTQAFLGNTTNPLECDIITTFSDGNKAFESTVHCKVNMLVGGSIVAEFYLITSNTNNDNYYMSVEIPIMEIDIENKDNADIKETSTETSVTKLYTYEIGYDFANAKIRKGTYHNEQEETYVIQ